MRCGWSGSPVTVVIVFQLLEIMLNNFQVVLLLKRNLSLSKIHSLRFRFFFTIYGKYIRQDISLFLGAPAYETVVETVEIITEDPQDKQDSLKMKNGIERKLESKNRSEGLV
jgi:hypothetical protein